MFKRIKFITLIVIIIVMNINVSKVNAANINPIEVVFTDDEIAKAIVEQLKLNNFNISDTSDMFTTEMRDSITSLDLSGIKMNNVRGLSTLTSLIILKANDCDLGDDTSPTGLKPFFTEILDRYNNGLSYLLLASNNISKLSYSNLDKFRYLDLSNNTISDLNGLIDQDASDSRLRALIIKKAGINKEDIINIINKNPLISELNISSNNLNEIFSELLQLNRLTSLTMDDNNISDIPDLFNGNTTLKNVSLKDNKITNFDNIFKLSNLINLYLDNNNIESIDNMPTNITTLKKLSFAFNIIKNVPRWLYDSSINDLNVDLSYNIITTIPNHFSDMASTNNIKVNFAYNPITEVPDEYFNDAYNGDRFDLIKLFNLYELEEKYTSEDYTIENFAFFKQFINLVGEHKFNFELFKDNNSITNYNDVFSIDSEGKLTIPLRFLSSSGQYQLIARVDDQIVNSHIDGIYAFNFKLKDKEIPDKTGTTPGQTNPSTTNPTTTDPNNQNTSQITNQANNSTITNGSDTLVNGVWYDASGNPIIGKYTLINGVWHYNGLPITGDNKLVVVTSLLVTTFIIVLFSIKLNKEN